MRLEERIEKLARDGQKRVDITHAMRRVAIPKGTRWGWGIDRRNGTMIDPEQVLKVIKTKK